MAHVVVLGAGVMGSAFAQLLADAGQSVALVGTHLDGEIITAVISDGFHPGLKVRLPKAVSPHPAEQLGAALREDTRAVVLGVNSAGVDWAVARLAPFWQKPIPILILTKGLVAENGSLSVLPRKIETAFEHAGRARPPVAGVAGPCIAAELAARRPSSVVIAHPDRRVLKDLLPLVDAPYYHPHASTDLVGVELCAALKNFYTLAIGAVAGVLEKAPPAANGARMHNAAAALFAQALGEIGDIVTRLGGDPLTVAGLAGAGDLYVTCLAGRNSRMGRLLGTGLRFRAAKAAHMPAETIEGAELAPVVEMIKGVTVDWMLIVVELVGIFVGSMVGPRTGKYIPEKGLRLFFIALALYVGIGYTLMGFTNIRIPGI